MNLIRFALRKPITIMVIVAGLFFFGIKSITSIKVDIFPKLDMPVIYISHPFTGYTPEQMESFFAKQYVNILLYTNGLKSIETKNIQGLTLMKLNFLPEGTNMAQAAGELASVYKPYPGGVPAGLKPSVHYQV
jgi:multidrug efflux pump subunit AcrB